MSTPIPLSGKLGSTRVDESVQKSVNMYPHNREGYRQFPGLVQFASLGAGTFRGGHVMGGIPYVVLNTTLYSIASNGAETSIGTILGSQRVVFDTDGTQLVMTAGVNKYIYTVAGGLVTLSDPQLGDTNTNAYLDNTFYYEQSNGRIFASNLADAGAIDALDFITAESFTDGVTRLFALNQLLYAFGTETTEIYYTSGTGNTRLSRQAVLEHGVAGRYAVDSIDNTIYLLDDERKIRRMQSTQTENIFIPGLTEEIDSYATVADCIISTYAIEQQNFIEMTFPTAGKTWVLHEPSGEVVQRQDTDGSRSRIEAYLKAYNKLLGVDHSTGQVYELSMTTYQDDGVNMPRELYSGVINSETFGIPSRFFILNSLQIDYSTLGDTTLTVAIEKAVDGDTAGALTTDADEIITTDEDVTLTANFTIQRTINLSGSGQAKLVNWGKINECLILLRTTGNTRVNILSMSGDVEPLGD